MPGQPFDRIAVLYNYLFHNTSKGHTVAVADILTNYRNHGYELEIKSFYRDKDVLNALDGIEIAYDHKTRGYWMKTDGFEPYELRLIVDSIQSSKFITQNVANRITAKVLRLTDRNTGATLNRRSFVAGRVRSMNDSVVKDADNLHIAIQTNRKVRFKYFHYDREKKSGIRTTMKPMLSVLLGFSGTTAITISMPTTARNSAISALTVWSTSLSIQSQERAQKRSSALT